MTSYVLDASLSQMIRICAYFEAIKVSRELVFDANQRFRRDRRAALSGKLRSRAVVKVYRRCI
jgi:Flp pilus assembly secretin CpaC